MLLAYSRRPVAGLFKCGNHEKSNKEAVAFVGQQLAAWLDNWGDCASRFVHAVLGVTVRWLPIGQLAQAQPVLRPPM